MSLPNNPNSPETEPKETEPKIQKPNMYLNEFLMNQENFHSDMKKLVDFVDHSLLPRIEADLLELESDPKLNKPIIEARSLDKSIMGSYSKKDLRQDYSSSLKDQLHQLQRFIEPYRKLIKNPNPFPESITFPEPIKIDPGMDEEQVKKLEKERELEIAKETELDLGKLMKIDSILRNDFDEMLKAYEACNAQYSDFLHFLKDNFQDEDLNFSAEQNAAVRRPSSLATEHKLAAHNIEHDIIKPTQNAARYEMTLKSVFEKDKNGLVNSYNEEMEKNKPMNKPGKKVIELAHDFVEAVDKESVIKDQQKVLSQEEKLAYKASRVEIASDKKQRANVKDVFHESLNKNSMFSDKKQEGAKKGWLKDMHQMPKSKSDMQSFKKDYKQNENQAPDSIPTPRKK